MQLESSNGNISRLPNSLGLKAKAAGITRNLDIGMIVPKVQSSPS
jgi:hypothetical protein